jgi:adenylate kinase family enzyme
MSEKKRGLTVKKRPSRVLVIGSGGAGKTTFSLALARLWDLPVVHLDRHFWRPGWKAVETPAWRRKIRSLIKAKRWIMDGNYGGSLDLRFPRADLVIYLDFPPVLCLLRALKRRVMFHGKSRPDIGPGCPESMDLEFLAWIWNFRRHSRPVIMEKVRRYGMRKRLVVFRSPRAAMAFLGAEARSSGPGL